MSSENPNDGLTDDQRDMLVELREVLHEIEETRYKDYEFLSDLIVSHVERRLDAPLPAPPLNRHPRIVRWLEDCYARYVEQEGN